MAAPPIAVAARETAPKPTIEEVVREIKQSLVGSKREQRYFIPSNKIFGISKISLSTSMMRSNGPLPRSPSGESKKPNRLLLAQHSLLQQTLW